MLNKQDGLKFLFQPATNPMLKKNFFKIAIFLAVITIISSYFSYQINAADDKKSDSSAQPTEESSAESSSSNQEQATSTEEQDQPVEEQSNDNTVSNAETDTQESSQAETKSSSTQNEESNSSNSSSASTSSNSDSGQTTTVENDYTVDVLLPQNGVTLSQNFQVKAHSQSELSSLTLYKLKMVDQNVFDESATRKIISLEYVDGDWIGVVDIADMENGTYHFQTRGWGVDQKEYRSSVFWVNIDKTAEQPAEETENAQTEQTKSEGQQTESKQQTNQQSNEQGSQANQPAEETGNAETEQVEPKEENTESNQPAEQETSKSDDIYFQISDLCIEAGLKNKEDCLKLFQEPNVCKNLNKQECQALIREVILADFISQDEMDQAGQEARSIVGYNLNIKIKTEAKDKKIGPTSKLEMALKKNGETSLADKSTGEFIKKFIPINLQYQKEINLMVLATQNKSTKLIPAVIALDDDSDGIPNDSEKRIGTNPNNADSDGDGYDDHEEVLNGYNPLGLGKITPDISARLAAVDLAIINHRSLEQPKEDGRQVNGLSIKKIGNSSTQSGKPAILLRGKAQPKSVITLYIYSQLPLVITTGTDANGNWVYELDEKLTDGAHQVYVAVNDNTGKVRYKSSPASFFIKEAKAVTRTDYLNTAANNAGRRSSSNLRYYLWGTLLIIILLVLIYLFLVRRQNRQPKITEE